MMNLQNCKRLFYSCDRASKKLHRFPTGGLATNIGRQFESVSERYNSNCAFQFYRLDYE